MFNHAAPVMASTVVVAVDVGKTTVALSVTDAQRHRLLGPLDFAMTRPGLAGTVKKVREVLPATDPHVSRREFLDLLMRWHYRQTPLASPEAV